MLTICGLVTPLLELKVQMVVAATQEAVEAFLLLKKKTMSASIPVFKACGVEKPHKVALVVEIFEARGCLTFKEAVK